MKYYYMGLLLLYQIVLVIIRRRGINKYMRDDVLDFVIEIIPIAICIMGALGE